MPGSEIKKQAACFRTDVIQWQHLVHFYAVIYFALQALHAPPSPHFVQYEWGNASPLFLQPVDNQSLLRSSAPNGSGSNSCKEP